MAASTNTKENWTDERIAILTDLVSKGASFSVIAAEISHQTGITLSRNACLSKAFRMGLTIHKRKAVEPIRRPRAETGTVGSKAGGVISRIKGKAAGDYKPAPLRVVHDADDFQPLHLTMSQLNRTTCRWPYDATPEQLAADGLSFRYCGCEKISGSPYCLSHDIRSKPVAEARKARVAA